MRIILLLDFLALIAGYSQGFLFPIEPEQPQEYPSPRENGIPKEPLFTNNDVGDTSSNENQGIQNEVQPFEGLPFLPVIGKQFRCPKPFGTYADPENCGRYYVCSYMVPLNYRCLFGLVFNDYSGRCMAKRYVDCGKRPFEEDVTTTIAITKTTESRATRPPKTTNSYVTTTNVPATTRKAPQTEFICPKMFGVYPDPDNCEKFFTCFFSKATHYTCTGGRLFDSKGYCRRRKNVDCGSRPDPESITTGEETTITEPPTFKTTETPYIKFTTRMENITIITEIPPLTTKIVNTTDEISRLFTEDIGSTSGWNKNTTEAITEIPPLTTKIVNTTDEISSLFTEDIGSTRVWSKNTTEVTTDETFVVINQTETANKFTATNVQDITLISDATKEDEESFECPALFGVFPHEKNCAKFYVCFAGQVTRDTCNNTELFDAKTLSCKESHEVDCGTKYIPTAGATLEFTRTTPVDTTESITWPVSTLSTEVTPGDGEFFKCPAVFGIYPHPQDCSKYFVCFSGKVSTANCHESQLFDTNYFQCRTRNEVDCGNRYDPIKIEDAFECPNGLGVYPHPRDCSRFFMCFGGKVSPGECNPTQLFDTRFYQCSDKDDVKCGNRFNPFTDQAGE